MEFARLIAMGAKQVDAYRKAFDCNGKTHEAITKAAQRLSKNVHVLAFVDNLRAETKSAAVIDREKRMEYLSQIVVNTVQAKPREAIAAIAELNKMDGAYEPEKVEVSGTLGVGAVVAALQQGEAEPLVR